MEAVARTLAHASGWLLLGLIAVALIQAFALYRLSAGLARHSRRWRTIAQSATGMDLESILADSARERTELVALFEGSQGRLARIEDRLATTKGQIGIVRYDAFPDVGGQNSFSLAVLDDAGDGFVVTSIVGREEGRVYGKGIIDGRSDRALSDEEGRAVEVARQTARPASRQGEASLQR